MPGQEGHLRLRRLLIRLGYGLIAIAFVALACMEADRVGPGSHLAALILSPDSVSIPAGDSVQFRAMGRDQDGDDDSIPVTWTATGGQVSASGLYTAGMISGAFRVIATAQGGTLSDTSTVQISPILVHVILVPATATLEMGKTLQFASYGRMSDGDSVAVEVAYKATGGSITPSGLFTADTTLGRFAVVATNTSGALADTSYVDIIPVLTRVVIVPPSASLDVGETQQLTAYGRVNTGDSVAVSVTYSAAGGTITPSGLYTAGLVAGTFQVVAIHEGGTLADTALVTITPTLRQVILVPDSVELDVGGTQQFSTYGRMSNGDSVAVSVTYKTTGGGGTITQAGLFTAGRTAGVFQVIATDQGGAQADTVKVTITPTLRHIVLTPDSIGLDVAETRQFAIFGRLSNDDSVAVNVTYSATGGSITSAGLYTSGQAAGVFRVVAVEQGGVLADTSIVTITPTLRRILMVPDSIGLDVADTQQFAPYGRMSNGDSVAVQVTFSATGGSIDSTGVYTAGRIAGTFQVIAVEQGATFADTSLVTITPTLRQVVLTPDSVDLDVGGTRQFATFGRLSNADSVPVTVTYAATGGTITTAGVYTAGQAAGTFQVIVVEQSGLLADTSIVSITPTMRHIVLVPDTIGLDVAETAQFNTFGRMSNGDSVVLSVTYTAGGGTITQDGLYTAGRSAGTYQVIAVEPSAGFTDTSFVTITPTVRQLVLIPDSAGLDVDETQQFSSFGRLSNGDSVAVSVTYVAAGGTISASGLYTAGRTAGAYHVIAMVQGGVLADTSTVTITPTLRQIILVPDTATLIAATTKQFATFGRMSNGDSVAVSVTYSATGGTITSSGLYTAGRTTGTFRVIARETSGTSLRDTSRVTIRAPTLAQVILTPPAVTLVEATTQQFAAHGLMNNGDSVAVSVDYTATGGTITSAGLYTAGRNPGTYRVIAKQHTGSLADTTSVMINPPTLVRVNLLPASVTLAKGASQQFTSYGTMDNGEDVAVSVNYSATGGTISSSGLYRAGTSTGTYHVIARQQGGTLSDTARVTITTASLAQVVLVPSSVSLLKGATQQFTAYGRMNTGDSVAVSVTYSATGGTISSSGLYKAGTSTGTFRVIAKQSSGSLADTSSVFITSAGSSVVFVGAGDIADCSSSGDEATAALLDNIAGSVFTLGDNAYSSGTPTEFSTCYDPSWGRHKSRTYPAPGNHDYNTSGAAGYFGYFGAAAGPSGRGYYSFDLGSWHIISLNSEVSMSAGSTQEKWLRADLAASTKQCTLAYWHKPRFSSGTHHGSMVDAEPLWQALYAYGAEIVLSGHEHNYERFAPQTPTGAADPARGIREFVVGTGGRSHYDIGTPLPNSETSNGSTNGVLSLTLGSGTYSWQFIPASGGSFTDSGSGTCH